MFRAPISVAVFVDDQHLIDAMALHQFHGFDREMIRADRARAGAS